MVNALLRKSREVVCNVGSLSMRSGKMGHCKFLATLVDVFSVRLSFGSYSLSLLSTTVTVVYMSPVSLVFHTIVT